MNHLIIINKYYLLNNNCNIYGVFQDKYSLSLYLYGRKTCIVKNKSPGKNNIDVSYTENLEKVIFRNLKVN